MNNRNWKIFNCPRCGNPFSAGVAYKGKYCPDCLEQSYSATVVDNDNRLSLRETIEVELLDHQQGGCAICGSAENLVLDHTHSTGMVRGLLCDQCNMAIGLFRDDPTLCVAAAKYLQSHNSGFRNDVPYRKLRRRS